MREQIDGERAQLIQAILSRGEGMEGAEARGTGS